MSSMRLDHINIRTGNLEKMVEFYVNILGLKPGPRPSFKFNGAWLYCGSNAAVHLVETSVTPSGSDPKLEHFAFTWKGLQNFLHELKRHDIPYRIATLPDIGITQVHISDPDGNHIEVAFGQHENEECGHDTT